MLFMVTNRKKKKRMGMVLSIELVEKKNEKRFI